MVEYFWQHLPALWCSKWLLTLLTRSDKTNRLLLIEHNPTLKTWEADTVKFSLRKTEPDLTMWSPACDLHCLHGSQEITLHKIDFYIVCTNEKMFECAVFWKQSLLNSLYRCLCIVLIIITFAKVWLFLSTENASQQLPIYKVGSYLKSLFTHIILS